MNCSYETELLDALGRGFVGAELEAHVAACESCSELRVVAGALLDDRAANTIDAPIPTAGTMWWRMRLRHRRENVARARRSLLIGQAATLTIAIALVVTFFGDEIASGARHALSTFHFNTPVLVALAMWLLVAPIGGWIAIRQK